MKHNRHHDLYIYSESKIESLALQGSQNLVVLKIQKLNVIY